MGAWNARETPPKAGRAFPAALGRCLLAGELTRGSPALARGKRGTAPRRTRSGRGHSGRSEACGWVKHREPIRHLEHHGCELLREGARHSMYVTRPARKASAVSRYAPRPRKRYTDLVVRGPEGAQRPRASSAVNVRVGQHLCRVPGYHRHQRDPALASSSACAAAVPCSVRPIVTGPGPGWASCRFVAPPALGPRSTEHFAPSARMLLRAAGHDSSCSPLLLSPLAVSCFAWVPC